MKFLAPLFLFATLASALPKKHFLFAKSCKLTEELADRKFPFSLNNGWTILEQEVSHYTPMLLDAVLRPKNHKTLPAPYKPNLFDELTHGFKKTVAGRDESKLQIYTKNSTTFFWGKDESYALVSLFIARNIILTEYNERIHTKLSYLKDLLSIQKEQTPGIQHKKRLFVLTTENILIRDPWVNQTFEVVYISSATSLVSHINTESQKHDFECETKVSIDNWHRQAAIKFVRFNNLRSAYYRKKALNYFSSPTDNSEARNSTYDNILPSHSSLFGKSNANESIFKKKRNKSEKNHESRTSKGPTLGGTFSKFTAHTKKILSKSPKKPAIDQAFIDEELKIVDSFQEKQQFTLEEAQEFASTLSRDMGPLLSLTVSLWNRDVDVDFWEYRCFNAVFGNLIFESYDWNEQRVRTFFLETLFPAGARPSVLFNALVDVNHIVYLHRNRKNNF